MKTRWGRRKGCAAGVVALALAAAHASVAFADVNGQLTAGSFYDDNIFRTPDGDMLAGFSKTDNINTLGAGGRISLTNEHFQLNVSGDISENWYSRNTFLNNFAYDGTLELTERQKFIDIDVQAIQSQALSSFADIRTPVKNLQALTRTAVRVGLAVTSDVRIVFDAKFNRDTNTSISIASEDYNQSIVGIGAGYFSPSSNSLVLEETRAYSEGVSPQTYLLDNLLVSSKVNYIDDTTLVQVSYSPSPVIGLYAQAGYLRRTDQSIFHANTNTPVGTLRLFYRPDSVVEVDVNAGRQLASQSYLLISGVADNYVKVNPSVTLSNAWKASADFSYDERNYGVVPELGSLLSHTSDNTARYDASLTYNLFDNYQFEITGYHEERHSNSPIDTYNDSGVTFTFAFRSARPPPRRDGVDTSDSLLLP